MNSLTILLTSYCRKYLAVHGNSIRRPGKMKSRVYAAFGDMADDSTGR